MESASSTGGQPSPQSALATAGKLFDAIHTQETYDQRVRQRGLEALEADIASVLTDIRNLMASASDRQLRLRALRRLVRLLSIKHMQGAMGQRAVDVGMVPVLVELLGGCEEVQKLAAYSLNLLAIHHAKAVADAGAVPRLVQAVASLHDDVRGPAICALESIADTSMDRIDAVLAVGILEPLLKAMNESSSIQVLAMGGELLGKLWSGLPLPVPLGESGRFLPVLVSLLSAPEQNELVRRSARGALRHFGGSVPTLVLRLKDLQAPILTVTCWSSVARWPR